MNLQQKFWRFFSSVRLAIFILCSLAVTSIIGTVIPQGQPAAFYVKQYGTKAAQFMQILDIPEMYSSWWFLALLGLLAVNLIVCSLDRFPLAWKIITQDNFAILPGKLLSMKQSLSWELHQKTASTVSFEQICKTLSAAGWRGETRDSNEGRTFFSQKGKWSRTGVYIVHISILVIFAGAVTGNVLGFKGSVILPELSTTDKIYLSGSNDTKELGFSVTCNSFGIEFYANGMPREYESSLTITEPGKQPYTQRIEVNKPLTHNGITFYQSSYQGFQDFIVTISDADKKNTKSFRTPFQKQLNWDNSGILFGIINAKAMGRRVVESKLWFKAGDAPAVIRWIGAGTPATITIGEKNYIVKVKQMYATGLQVSKDPGVWIVYLGCGLMILGLYIAFFMSHTRLWLVETISEKGEKKLILAGNTNKNKAAFDKKFAAVKDTIDAQLQMTNK
ncbi:MAG: cytochrome C biogenesis protein ResB [Acidobacteria bacterium]|nr:MAG: cytochrome C biogenesis protein ResB [Acidobacteriota bacterium]